MAPCARMTPTNRESDRNSAVVHEVIKLEFLHHEVMKYRSLLDMHYSSEK